MTTSTRNKLLILGLAVLVVGIIVVLTLFDKDESPEIVEEETPAIVEEELGVSSDIDTLSIPSGLELVPEPEVIMVEGRTASLQMAELFAERYGSYSNQGDYQNLKDLLPIMTSSYRASTKKFLDSVKGTAPATSYEGYTAIKISSEELSFNDVSGSAQYEIVLQQIKVADATETKIEYPKLQISLKRIGDDWRVDKVEWSG